MRTVLALIVMLVFAAPLPAQGQWVWRYIKWDDHTMYAVQVPEWAGYITRNGVRYCLCFANGRVTPGKLEYTVNNPFVTNAEWFASATP